MSRYWNGHQWKELVPDEPTQRADESTMAPVPPAVRASMVPTHAEYGDAFVAAAAEATTTISIPAESPAKAAKVGDAA